MNEEEVDNIFFHHGYLETDMGCNFNNNHTKILKLR